MSQAVRSDATVAPVRQGNRDIYIALGLVGTLLVMILPLPPLVLDLFLSLSICISLITFMVAIYIKEPLELSVFPSLVLMATLMRLALNVASTRLILLHGHEGPNAAGSVIHAFGQFVVGGNYLVGLIIFLILVVINFMVITKGAGRVAEVAARFTLDAMPGKQMAIDADLAAGLITDRDARVRRSRIQQEADFHGAMDGSSKFVRGDAVAGLVITAINVIGGIAIGILQHNMVALEAAQSFTILSVGDGLVAQVPALLMSTAAGIIVTRAADERDLGTTLADQLTTQKRPAAVTAVVLGLLAIVPGMPHLTFLVMSSGAAWIAWRGKPKDGDAAAEEPGAPKSEQSEQEVMEQLLPIDLLELEIGYELVGLVDGAKDGNLLGRISGIRRQFATELGVVVPPIHVRDNLQLKPGEYRLLLSGNEVGRGEVRVGRYLAMCPADAMRHVPGEQVSEPAFGLPARWVAPANRSTAETMGFTVVDAATVIATHVSELLRKNSPDLLGRGEVQELLDVFGKRGRNVLDELIPNLLPLGSVIKVLRNLLREGISIRDLRTILETLADHAGQMKDPDALTEQVRQRMAKSLTGRVLGSDGRVHALVIDPQLEQDLRRALRAGADAATFDTTAIPRLLSALERSTSRLGDAAGVPVLVVAPDVRPHVASFAARHVPGLSVYSYREIEPNTPINTLGVIGAE
ncbi:MAG: flagellar biosynthesis protein FlhA [Deltaproteobacteria bacterium]|nr:flagellar biosynthesis protein FlhA [Deltaproteobacteria bacterium]